jgi:hypothetical protein
MDHKIKNEVIYRVKDGYLFKVSEIFKEQKMKLNLKVGV